MTIPPLPPPSAYEVQASRSDRFFLWIAGIGITRADGWIGGVSSGLAARLRIDPLIVRGVLVVAALFGLPVIFAYAVAWALLPDADGRVHARDLIHGHYQPVQLGILITALIGLIPSAPVIGGWIAGLWYNPYQYEQYNSSSWSPLSILGWIIGLTLVSVLLVFIVRAARRTPGASSRRPSMASTDAAAPDASVLVDSSGTVDGTDAIEPDAGGVADSAAPASALIDAPPIAPAALPAGEQTPDDLEAWRQQHAAWKEQDQAWRRQQQDAERAARDQLRRERQIAGAAFAVEASERRRLRRATKPRASFAYVASAIGLAIVIGALVGLSSGLDVASGALGLFAAALVLAAAMIISGIARRRSGFLAFVTTIVLLGGIVAGGFSAFQDVRFGWASISNNDATHIAQPFGELYIMLHPHDDGPRPITVDKGSGDTTIYVDPGVQLDLRASVGTTIVNWMRVDQATGRITDTGVWEPARNSRTIDTETSAKNASVQTIQPVTISQESGEIRVTIYERAEGDQK